MWSKKYICCFSSPSLPIYDNDFWEPWKCEKMHLNIFKLWNGFCFINLIQICLQKPVKMALRPNLQQRGRSRHLICEFVAIIPFKMNSTDLYTQPNVSLPVQERRRSKEGQIWPVRAHRDPWPRPVYEMNYDWTPPPAEWPSCFHFSPHSILCNEPEGNCSQK